MGLFKDLSSKLNWGWEFGVNREDKSLYRLEFVSKPVPDSVCKFLSEKYIKLASGKSIQEAVVGDVFELPDSVVKHNELALLWSLPNVKPFGEKILTRKVVDVCYKKVVGGWVISVGVEGVRRLF